MVLVHEYSLPGRILARRAVAMAAGGVEQQPPVGETPLLARSPALSSISLAFLGAAKAAFWSEYGAQKKGESSFLLGIRSLSMYIDAIPWLVPGGAA